MAVLLVKGEETHQTLQFTVPDGKVVRLGRAPRSGVSVPWDIRISREHAELFVEDDHLRVRCLATARNPLRYNGQFTDEVALSPGDEFRIGNTDFQYVNSEAEQSDGVEERTFRPEDLESIKFGNESRRLEMLAQLPDLIAKSSNERDLAQSLVHLVLKAVPSADAVAVLAYANSGELELDQPKLMQWDSRTDVGRFRPSRRLIRDALTRGQTILHYWSDDKKPEDPSYTQTTGLLWAFCIPVQSEQSAKWCVYVSGTKMVREQNLMGDLRYAELLGKFLGAVRKVRHLEHQQAEMSQFFSPAVIETLSGGETEKFLVPRESDITVLFCDVRGFSRHTERAKDNLLGLLERVSDALGVMTKEIMKYEGVIADFQGDAALAFWGWPTPTDEGPLSACLAALAMFQEFNRANQDPDDSLSGFKVGIGIGHGRAIAGRIGTSEQVKVGVFGPVVNLAARLESMTKQFRVSILMDESTTEFVSQHMPSSIGRARKLARVQPLGMELAVTVAELLPPFGQTCGVTDEQIRVHEEAVDAFIAGNWSEAQRLFEMHDDLDRSMIAPLIFMAEHNFQPPDDWDGVMHLTSK